MISQLILFESPCFNLLLARPMDDFTSSGFPHRIGPTKRRCVICAGAFTLFGTQKFRNRSTCSLPSFAITPFSGHRMHPIVPAMIGESRLWKITISNGKTHYKWQFSIVM